MSKKTKTKLKAWAVIIRKKSVLALDGEAFAIYKTKKLAEKNILDLKEKVVPIEIKILK